MQIDVMLCDHGQVVGDKLFISGGGIDRFQVVDVAGSYPVTFAVAGLVSLLPQEAGAHVLGLRLVHANGDVARLAGAAEGGAVGGELEITGDPAQVSHVQTASFAFVFQGVPLATPGSYAVICTLDGVEVRWLWFDVVGA